LEVARAEVVTFQETVDALQSQAAVRQDIQRVEGDLTARRQEVWQLAASLPGLEEQVRDLRREERAQANTRQALQAQASRVREQHSRVTAQLDGLLAVEPSLGMLSSLSTISEPAEPASPASPQRSRNILLATFLGLMVGTAAALFWDFYRNPTATPQQDPG
jgi:uncharacterized protein involved in exopolysaccharide biosynthesis